MKWILCAAFLLFAAAAEAGSNRVLLVQESHCNQRVQAVRVQRIQRVQRVAVVQPNRGRNVQIGLLNIGR